MTTISIPTSFNYPVSAWQMGRENSTKLAILMPGFLDSKDYVHLKTLGKDLAEQGYLVICFDILGVWESKAPIELYTMTNWLTEIQDVVSWAKEQYPQMEKIVLGGHSMGGMMSLFAAANYSEIDAAISIMGGAPFVREETYQKRMVEWKAEMNHTSYRDNPARIDQKISITLPFSFVVDSLQFDVLKVIKSIHCPVLLIAGESDQLVSVESMRELHESFTPSQSKFRVFDAMGHDYRKHESDIKRVNDSILQFLKEKV